MQHIIELQIITLRQSRSQQTLLIVTVDACVGLDKHDAQPRVR